MLLLFAFLPLFGMVLSVGDEMLTVATVQGKIEGSWIGGGKCRAFVGVPFAQPPLTDLRFQPPAEPTPWGNDTVLQTKKRSSICISMPNNLEIPEENEDCLYLHVVTGRDWKPKPKKKRRPVLVWIHGGGFVGARSFWTAEAACENFVSRHVLMVAIQYRVGYLGFLATGDETATGNYGLMDQIAALKWIHENIANFGGDPTQVTVAGSSAGGVSASLLSYMQAARPFMTRVISQSGSPFAYWAFNERSAVSLMRLLPAVDCKRRTPADSLDCLRRKPIEELQHAHLKEFGPASYARRPRGKKPLKFAGGGQELFDVMSFDWSPRLDNRLLTKPLTELTIEPLPTITGVTNQECLVFAKPWLYWSWLWEKAVRANLPNVTQFWIDDDEEEYFEIDTLKKAVKDACSIYQHPYMYHPENRLESDPTVEMLADDLYVRKAMKKEDEIRNLYQLAADFWMNLPALLDAQNKKHKGGRVWMYNFDNTDLRRFPKGTRPAFIDAIHDDVGHLILARERDLTHSRDAVEMRNILLDLWTNFARFGQPTPDEEEKATEGDDGRKGASFDFVWRQFESLYKTAHLRITLPQPKMEENFKDPYMTVWSVIAAEARDRHNTRMKYKEAGMEPPKDEF